MNALDELLFEQLAQQRFLALWDKHERERSPMNTY